jgi:hypothetical protein
MSVFFDAELTCLARGKLGRLGLSTEPGCRMSFPSACGLRCINIQARRLHVESAAGLLSRGHHEDASNNRAPTRLIDMRGR